MRIQSLLILAAILLPSAASALPRSRVAEARRTPIADAFDASPGALARVAGHLAEFDAKGLPKDLTAALKLIETGEVPINKATIAALHPQVSALVNPELDNDPARRYAKNLGVVSSGLGQHFLSVPELIEAADNCTLPRSERDIARAQELAGKMLAAFGEMPFLNDQLAANDLFNSHSRDRFWKGIRQQNGLFRQITLKPANYRLPTSGRPSIAITLNPSAESGRTMVRLQGWREMRDLLRDGSKISFPAGISGFSPLGTSVREVTQVVIGETENLTGLGISIFSRPEVASTGLDLAATANFFVEMDDQEFVVGAMSRPLPGSALPTRSYGWLEPFKADQAHRLLTMEKMPVETALVRAILSSVFAYWPDAPRRP